MIAFDRVMLSILQDGNGTTRGIQGFEVIGNLQPISPSRFTRTGKATKVTGPLMKTENNGITKYSSFWQPIGMEGFTVRIQASLIDIIDGSYKFECISDWVTNVDTGSILTVDSNRCNKHRMEDTNYVAYDFMKLCTYWYVDSINIKAVKGIPNKADMELNLMRLWE